MRDLTVHAAYACVSNRSWSKEIPASGGGTYTLKWERLYGYDAEIMGCDYGYTCTCEGFKHRSTCKHVKAAYAEDLKADKGPEDRCTWDAQFETGEAVEVPVTDDNPLGKACPMCGRPVFAYQYGA